MIEFRMPSLGADLDAGTLVEWKVRPGDPVARGAIVAVVETQKGIVEIECWQVGRVEALIVEPGTKVPVGTVLATLRDEANAAEPEPEPEPEPATGPAPAASPWTHASPAARQLAREHGIDVATVAGTGRHGVVTRADVERIAHPAVPNAQPAVPPDESPHPAPRAAPGGAASAMRRAIAAAMSRSKREIPHYYLSSDISVGPALAWLATENARRPVPERLLFAALQLKAVALAAREVQDVNGFFLDGEHRPSPSVHVGVAIHLRQGGLVAPALHAVETLPLTDVMAGLRDLVARTRGGTLRASELVDATITVTNLGDQGVDAVFGVIHPPQVAIVGFGKVVERPWAENGLLGVRPTITMTLAADHRVSDGHRGAQFLAAVGRLLGEPERL